MIRTATKGDLSRVPKDVDHLFLSTGLRQDDCEHEETPANCHFTKTKSWTVPQAGNGEPRCPPGFGLDQDTVHWKLPHCDQQGA